MLKLSVFLFEIIIWEVSRHVVAVSLPGFENGAKNYVKIQREGERPHDHLETVGELYLGNTGTS
jgi:hypothetical protein